MPDVDGGQRVVGTGDVLGGRYELVDHLGGGGMADVYRAVDRNLHREVAVKLLAQHRLADDRMVDRFRREARSAASLNHPNVVSVHDTGDDGDAHYIVMELLHGPTLDDVIRDEGPLDLPRAAAIAIEVCAGLSAAHANGVVHRDVKPSNIMFDRSGAVKVSDFGIALVGTDTTVTQTASVYGSVPFLAPEVARGDDVDGRADVYGLGCVLFAMLTGRPPFQADEPLAIVYQHLHGPRPRPSDVRSEVPDDLDAIVLRCLAVDPNARYASAAELRRDLGAHLRGETPPVALGGAALASTQVLPPVDETVAIGPGRVDPAVAATSPGPEPATAERGRGGAMPDQRSWGPRRWLLLVLFVAAALIAWALLARLVGGDAGGPLEEPTGAATAPPAAETTSPEPTPTDPSPTPTPDVTEVDETVEDVVGDLIGIIAAGSSTGAIDAEAGRELAKTGRELVRHLERGDAEGSLERLEELREQVDEYEARGSVDPDTADAIRSRTEQLELLIEPFAEGDADDRGGGPPERGGDGDGDDDDGP